jgi:hypothetical protein
MKGNSFTGGTMCNQWLDNIKLRNTYGENLWQLSWNLKTSSSLNKCFKSKLQICQNTIVRFVHGMGPRDSGNNVILANMSLLNVEKQKWAITCS